MIELRMFHGRYCRSMDTNAKLGSVLPMPGFSHADDECRIVKSHPFTEIHINTHLCPAVEMILLLERSQPQTGEIPSSVAAAAVACAERYDVPLSKVQTLTQTIQAMEKELFALLIPRAELWRSLFYPDSQSTNMPAWGLYFLGQDGLRLESDPMILKRLTAMMLCCELEQLQDITVLSDLMQFLNAFPCDSHTKWACAQVWQSPMQFFDQYCTLVSIATPIVEKYDALLQPFINAAVMKTEQGLRNDPEFLHKQFGQEMPPTNSLLIQPMAENFNGIGFTWDHTDTSEQAHLMIGILRDSIQDLARQYSDNSEFLAERLKTLSDKRRVDILKALKNRDMYGWELAQMLELSPATISHHMSMLAECELISVEKQGVKTCYKLDRQNLDCLLNNLRSTLL